jgi:hypothetical protein
LSEDSSAAVSTLPEASSEKLYVPTPLAQGNSVAGHRLEMAWRKDNVAVFARSIPGRAPHEYEVVIIRIAPAAVSPSGTLIPKREEYPSSSKWGTLGWSIPKRDQATAWAEMAVGNLELPREGRTAWPELFSRFKTKICNQIKKNGLQVVHGHCRWDDSSKHAKITLVH